MGAQGLNHLVANRHHRVERILRVLQDHGDAAPAQLAPLLRSLGAVSFRQGTVGGNYTVDHSATLYLIDGQGQLAAVFTPPFSLPALESDLKLAARALER